MSEVPPLGQRLRGLAGGHPLEAQLCAAADALDDAGPGPAAGLFSYGKPFCPRGYMAALNRVRALVKVLSADPGQDRGA